jgi:ribosomal protein L40E
MAQGGDALVYCHECGTQLPPSAAFCSKCGTRLMSQDPRKKNDTNDDDAEKAYQDFRVN